MFTVWDPLFGPVVVVSLDTFVGLDPILWSPIPRFLFKLDVKEVSLSFRQTSCLFILPILLGEWYRTFVCACHVRGFSRRLKPIQQCLIMTPLFTHKQIVSFSFRSTLIFPFFFTVCICQPVNILNSSCPVVFLRHRY